MPVLRAMPACVITNVTAAAYALPTPPCITCAICHRRGRSKDYGQTWNTSIAIAGNWTGGSTPVLQHNGVVYRALEWLDRVPAPFPQNKYAAMLWANATTDLLDPASWSHTPGVPFNRSWIPPQWARYNWTSPGCVWATKQACQLYGHSVSWIL